MTEHALTSAVEALEIAVFEQRPDGGFRSVAPVPSWFRTFGKSTTFPFLGSFLDEARAFWSEPRATPLKWGPCAEIDESGRQVQFIVSAVSAPTHKFLIFELDRHIDDIQHTLQKAREQALIHEAAIKDVRTCATAIVGLTRQLHEAPADPDRDELLQRLSRASETLIQRIEGLEGLAYTR